MFGIFAVIVGFLTLLSVIDKPQLPKLSSGITIILMAICIALIYFAPEGFDKMQYRDIYLGLSEWSDRGKDLGWEVYNSILRHIFGPHSNLFFLTTAILYTLCFYVFSRYKLPTGYEYYFLVLLFISLGYYSGGTNVMRTGIATGLIYVALAQSRKLWWFALFSFLAYTIHGSALLMIAGLVIGMILPKNKIYLGIWMICALLSKSGILTSFISPLLDDTLEEAQRLNKYLNASDDVLDLYENMGWRLDFIIYSAIPLIFVWFYKYKCGFKDKFYDMVITEYLLCNSFWLCVIIMPFTDRVALLSWVFIPILCSYPIFISNKIKNKGLTLAAAITVPLSLQIMYLIR